MVHDRLTVGRVAKAHGIRGEVAVEVLTDVGSRFAPGAVVWSGERTLTVKTSRPHQGRLLVCFDEIPDRTGAEGLRGALLEIPASDAAPIEDPWSYYPFQLEGLTVVDTAGVTLGTMLRVEESGAHDLWVVAHDGRDVLVPAVRAIVVGVDLEAGVVTLDPPGGLFEEA